MAALSTTLRWPPVVPATSLPSKNPLLHPIHRRLRTACKAKDTGGEGGGEAAETFETLAVVGGVVSNPVIGVSLYALKTTGCGLPPGPGGALGALEGVSYLVVAGIVAGSIYTKSKTGSGLPSGPYGLLGVVEGLSYLAVLGVVVVFGLQFLDKGFVPGPLPGDQCFG